MLRPLTGLLLLSLAAPASAATLDGDTIDVSYTIRGSSTSLPYASYHVPTGPIVLPIDPSGQGSIAGDTVSYTFGQSVDFSNDALTSVTFTDTDMAKAITGVDFGSDTTPALTANTLSYTADSFTISFADVTANKGDVIEIVAGVAGPTVGTVPLPASAPLFAAAVLFVGAVGYGSKRRRGSAA